MKVSELFDGRIMVNFGFFEIPARVGEITIQSICTFSAVLILLVVIGAANAAEAPKHINVDSEGYSIDRYDPVAYFNEGRPLRGKREFNAEYQGAKYAFSSDGNRERFLRDPDKYVPQYGGYCAWAASQNTVAGIDPDQFTIVSGKLYLNYNEEVKDMWLVDTTKHIADGDKNWPGLLVSN